MTAQQIVNKLLEVYGFPGGASAGSPEDPWRKGGHKPLKFKRGDFEGKRPPEPTAPAEPGGEVPIEHGEPETIKPKIVGFHYPPVEKVSMKHVNQDRGGVLDAVEKQYILKLTAAGVPEDEARRRWASFLNRLENGDPKLNGPSRFFWKPPQE